MPIKVGDALPDVTLFENNPDTKISAKSLGKGKAVIFAVPGAFTPGCSKTHMPGFIENADKIKAKGVTEIICIGVNDPFVMEGWGKVMGACGKVRCLADPRAEFAKALGMELDLTGMLGSVRSKRFSMVVEGGVVKKLNVEPDSVGLTCSLAPNILTML